jgi:hypothetical protein
MIERRTHPYTPQSRSGSRQVKTDFLLIDVPRARDDGAIPETRLNLSMAAA